MKNILIYFLFFLIIIVSLGNLISIQLKKNTAKTNEPIVINLLTSVHPNLPWKFKSLNKKIKQKKVKKVIVRNRNLRSKIPKNFEALLKNKNVKKIQLKGYNKLEISKFIFVLS